MVIKSLKHHFQRGKSPKPDKTSVLLRSIVDDLPDGLITIGTILEKLGRRSFGGILILIAALGLLPGISMITGAVMVLLGLQMVCGFKSPTLPKFVTALEIDIDRLRQIVGKSTGYIERIEKWVRPRWFFLARPGITLAIGIVTIGLGLIVMLPLPFSNLPPAIALVLLALGQLERDGKVIFAGFLVSLASLGVGMFFASVAIESISQFLR